MGFKKILFGEKVPDKDDPKYKERYEKDVAAGKNFAKALHLDKGAACVQFRIQAHETFPRHHLLVCAVQRRSQPVPHDTGCPLPSSTLQCHRAAGEGTAFQASSRSQGARHDGHKRHQ